jgi:hypothetical protein
VAVTLVGAAPLLASSPAGAATPSTRAPSAPAFERVGTTATLPPHSSLIGTVPSRQQVSAEVVLQPSNASGLAAYASAVSTPSSRLYRHYFSPSAFATLFAPPAAQVALVEAALSESGLTVGQVLDDGFIIPVSGSAATMSTAFRTSLLAVRLRDGTIGRLATSAPALPAAVAPSVSAVVGLDVLAKPERLGVSAPSPTSAKVSTSHAANTESVAATSGGPSTCAAATAVASEFSGYTPNQVAFEYGLDGLYKAGNLGAGQSVDIFELEPFAESDLATFDKCVFGTSHTSQVTVVPIDGGEAPGYGSGEAALDVEEVSALAPGAHINVYEAPQTFPSWLDEIAAIVSQDQAPVVSTSWGLCESYLNEVEPGFQQVENVFFEQAALEGQSWFAASGDSGSAGCERDTGETELSVSDPASQPYVTGVGGTSVLAPTDPPTEVVWNDGPGGGGGGGGLSNLWQMPAWQSGLQVPGVQNSYSSGTPCTAPTGVECREVPDVSGASDEYHGDAIVIGGEWNIIGGTSAAAPKWAAIAAMTNATCASEHVATVGFANPALYQIAANAVTYGEAFNDIKLGNNDNAGANAGAYPATPGYDLATGLGTPKVTSPTGGTGLAALLCTDGGALSSRPVLTGVSPTFGSYQGGTAVTITGTDLTGVTAVNFGASVAPVTPGDITGGGTQINVTTPASTVNPGIAGAPVGGVVVTVGGPGGSSEPTPAAEFHFVDENSSSEPIPSVSYIGPSAGASGGGETVLIIGSGFQDGLSAGTKPTVMFGGVPLEPADVTVVSDSQLSVVVPAESPSTDCATAPAVPTSDICQVQVTVGNSNGTSATGQILPAPTGSTQEAQPPNTELVAGPTEFDYAPPPTTTSISPTELPIEANPFGGQIPTVTITGTGFNYLTLLGVIFGPTTSSYATNDLDLLYIDPGEIQVLYFGLIGFPNITSMPVTVESLGGSSNPQTVGIATVPNTSSISVHAGPTTGGTVVTATGSGFDDVTSVDFFTNLGIFPGESGSTSNFTVNSSTSVTFTTPASLAGSGVFEVCNVAGCGFSSGPSVSFSYYEPVQPVVASVSPATGPAAGGVFATITGTGLGSVVSVDFGNVRSALVANPEQPFGSGQSDTRVVALVPPGPAGTSVHITVTTLAGKSAPAASFSYLKSAPAAPATVHARGGAGSISVSWAASPASGGSPLLRYVVSATPLTGTGLTATVSPSTLHVTLAPASPGVRYTVTVSAVNALGRTTAPAAVVIPSLGENGYLIAGTTGYVAGFGSLGGAPSGVAGRTLPAPIVGIAGTADGKGYWMVGADGSVYALGSAHDYGSLTGVHLGAPIVGIAATPDGKGYWLVAADGGVFGFGNARFHGSLGGKHLNRPIVGLASTSDGRGYWLVASDGGVFTFGDARFKGSLGGGHLNGSIVAIMADSLGGVGYWLGGADGGSFPFGNAKYRGSLAGQVLPAPIVAAVATPDELGYWMLGRTGDVYHLGDAVFAGSAQGLLGGETLAIGL